MTAKLWILAALLLLVLVLAIAVGSAKPGPGRRTLARLGATAFFAFLAAFFWLSPFTTRGGFLTGMAVFFSIGGLLSVWKLLSGLRGGDEGSESATH